MYLPPLTASTQSEEAAIREAGAPEADAPSESLESVEVTDIPEEVPETPPSLASLILQTAFSQLGTPYRWGGNDPETGFDCSGFVRWVFGQNGVALPRSSREQARVGTTVSRDELRPGDLLFYSRRRGSQVVGHVGIYVGDGSFIHSPRRGEPIQEAPAFDRYRKSVFLGARRVIFDPDEALAAAETARQKAEEAAGTSAVEAVRYYIVKKGDYIWALAKRFQLSPFLLLEANGLKKTDILRIGQRLVIPDASQAGP